MHLVYPPIFCITIVLDFSWDECNTQKKLKTRVMQFFFFFFFGGGEGGWGVNKVHYGQCESSEKVDTTHIGDKEDKIIALPYH